MICEDCHREATIATKRATCAPLVEEASCAWCGYLRSSYAQRESRRLMTGWTETISFKLPPPPLPRNCNNNNNNLLKTRVASAISRDGNKQYKILRYRCDAPRKYVMESTNLNAKKSGASCSTNATHLSPTCREGRIATLLAMSSADQRRDAKALLRMLQSKCCLALWILDIR
jgi:hypothetical protein